MPGQQITLSNVDLRSLFALDNLSGIDPLSYSKALPDGVYSFCFQAYDWFTKNNLSQKACAIAFFNQYEPPFLTLPQNGERIPALSPYDNGAAAMIFQWQPRQIAPNTRYVFTLKELWDLERDPISGFLAAPPFWQEEVFSPTLFYGLDKAQLIPGKRYAWQVQAKSGNPVYSASPTEDNGTYKNNGLSEIFYFDYTENCKTPSLLTAQNAGRGKVKIQWMLNGASAGDYNVQYRKRGTTGEWITAKSYQSPYFITGLEDLTEYEYRVGSVCGNLQNFNSDAYAYSAIQYFTTDSKDKSNENFQCGIMPAIDISNKTIYQGALGVNDVIIAGDFPVTITQANGIGNYSGEGYIIVPYLGDTKLKVSFNNIQINTDKKLIAGTIETTYDPSEKAVIERSDLTDAIAQIFNDLGGIVTDVYKDIKGGVEATIIVDNFIKTFLENIDDIPNILEEDKQKLKEGISSPEFREKLVQVVKEKREDIAKNGITEEEFKDVFKTSFTEATNNVSVDIDEKSSVSKTEIAIGFDSDNMLQSLIVTLKIRTIGFIYHQLEG
ncbi:Fibronectin type III domain-containing protein (plasmid) [Bergeyella porcorum]|uniref:Fibronectin type III domain-containing protein n=1 Tax=Bergeyella porcorum TaxID=1735111 RepID=A0AAU0F6V5_9FLAO